MDMRKSTLRMNILGRSLGYPRQMEKKKGNPELRWDWGNSSFNPLPYNTFFSLSEECRQFDGGRTLRGLVIVNFIDIAVPEVGALGEVVRGV